MTTVASAWEEGRELARKRAEQRATRRRATVLSVLFGIVRVVAARAPRWHRLRSGLMQWSGLGLFTFAGFQWHLICGLCVAGASLLILEALGRGDRE